MSRLLDPEHGGGALVGRATARAAIDALLADAGRGQGGALVLAGPAGIGKSALVHYATDVGSELRLVRTAGVESEMAFGYAGVHQVVLPILDHLDEVPAPQRVALEAALGRVQVAGLDPFLVGLAVLTLVAEAARAQPRLVIVDDAQWLDEESAMALSFVGRRLRAERVAMLFALREPSEIAAPFDGLRRLDLAGLSATDARTLLFRSAAQPVDRGVADRVVAATEGNPLALVELPRVLTVEQLRGAATLPDPLPIGEHLSDLFAARVGALDTSAQTVLLLAAAERLGDPRVVRRAATAGSLAWDEAVADAEASGLVTFAPTIEFRHPLVRSAVYYAATAADRRRAHAALADALDADPDVDRRAWHLGAAAAGPDEPTAQALEASAERARQRGGSSTAAAYLWRAAELTPDRARAAERLLEAGRAALVVGNVRQASEIFDRARRDGLGAEHEVDAAWAEALVHIVSGTAREPAVLLAGALPRIEPGDTELAVGASLAAHASALAGGHLIDAPIRRSIAARTVAATVRCEVGDPLAQLVGSIAARLADGPGDGEQSLHQVVSGGAGDQRRLQSASGRHVHIVYFEMALAAADTLDDEAWDHLIRAWEQVARASGALAALPLALASRTWLEVLQGRVGAAASHLAEIEEVVSLTSSRGLLGSPAPAQVLRDAWLGEEEATRTAVRRMMQDANERGLGIAVDHGYAALAILEIGAGRYDAALRAARRVLDHDSVGVATVSLADVVESAVRCGDVEIAEVALERLAERATTSGTPWAAGMLARARAILASDEEAEALFLTAVDELSRSTIATETARTQLLYGEWLRRLRRRKDAREPLREALDFFEAVGATGFALRARSELAATGEHVRSRSAPVDVLTPQEAQIARLAAAGERNREIAAQLYISTSTVEYHLRKVFMKLGVTSRTQLAQVGLPT